MNGNDRFVKKNDKKLAIFSLSMFTGLVLIIKIEARTEIID